MPDFVVTLKHSFKCHKCDKEFETLQDIQAHSHQEPRSKSVYLLRDAQRDAMKIISQVPLENTIVFKNFFWKQIFEDGLKKFKCNFTGCDVCMDSAWKVLRHYKMDHLGISSYRKVLRQGVVD